MGIRIVLADDHQLFLDGLRALLAKEPEIQVVAEASDGREALAEARGQRPDVVVMDLSMPGLNGIEATRRIVQSLPSVRVICLSMHTEPRFVEAALEAGASGYLPKDCATEEMTAAIRAVSNGQTYLSPSVAGVVVDVLRNREGTEEANAFGVLTGREREVLQLLAEGQSTKELAAHLNLSVKTVGTHREHIMRKLGIRSIAGLTKYAIREGLTSPEP